MKMTVAYIFVLIALAALVFLVSRRLGDEQKVSDNTMGSEFVQLPPPGGVTGGMSLGSAISGRRSVREFDPEEAISLAELSGLLWAAQGVTGAHGAMHLRSTPSAGALYPLNAYVVAGRVDGLSPALYRYQPDRHALSLMRGGDLRAELQGAALNQSSVGGGAINIVITAMYERSMVKYHARAVRYCDMEAGAVSENIYLMATSLGLGTVLVGAFEDDEVRRIMGLGGEEHPLSVMPVGRRIKSHR